MKYRPGGKLVDEKWVEFLELNSVDESLVRSPISWRTLHACAVLYGATWRVVT